MEYVSNGDLDGFFHNAKGILSDSSEVNQKSAEEMTGLVRSVDDKEGSTRTNVVYLNTDCNLRCEYCYEKDSREGLEDQANCTEKQIDAFLNEIQQREKGRNSCIVIMGGEPLLKFDLLEYLIRRAMSMYKPEGWAIPVTTNGLMFLSNKLISRYQTLMDDVGKCRTVIHDIEISFDVSGQYRRKMPDGSDSRPYVERAIKKVDEINFPYRFSYTVQKANYNNIVKDLVYLLEAYPNAKRIALSWAHEEIDGELGRGESFNLKKKIRPYANHLFKLYGKPICDACCAACQLCDKSTSVGNSYLSPTEGILYADKRTEKKFNQF